MFFMMLALVLFQLIHTQKVGAVVKGILGGKSIEDAFDSIDREPLKGISDSIPCNRKTRPGCQQIRYN